MRIENVEFAEPLNILEELQAQLQARGINYLSSIKDDGDNIMVTCPYHKNGQERRPSAGIRKSDGLLHCFTCGSVHSLPEVVSFCFTGQDDGGAFGWSWLLKNFATVGIRERRSIELDFSRTGIPNNVNYVYVGEAELEKYRYIHPYMYKRGLTDEVIELFDVGYDVETNCITFPIRDVHGNCLFVARRSVNTKFFNYPQGAEKPLYGLYELQIAINYYDYYEGDWEVIVCESMLDALSFWTVGKYAVALNGLGNELQFKQLRELPCRKIILATDMDEAGQSARQRIRKNITNKLVTEYIFPKGRKDANECTKEELMYLQEVF